MRRTVPVALLLLGTLLAGCSDGGPDGGSGGDNTPAILVAGKGAIAGLLVDDRFRPLQLTDNPTSEFQTEGFVLLQETGEQVQTSPDGEFTFVDLEPGAYTLRVQAEGHEATPERVTVEAGLFAESTVIARRVADVGGTVLTQEHSLFVFCAVNAGLPLSDACYNVDQSGDSGRVALYIDLTSINDTLTVLVTEALANQDGNYDLWIGHDMSNLGGPTEYFAQRYYDGRYLKCVNVVGEANTDCDKGLNSPFHVQVPLEYVWWVNGELDNEVSEALLGLPFTGFGADFAIKGKFLLSAFLGEPEVDIESYCLLCP